MNLFLDSANMAEVIDAGIKRFLKDRRKANQ
jgi:hypothetical protein